MANATEKQIAYLSRLAVVEKQMELADYLADVGAPAREELSKAQANALIKSLLSPDSAAARKDRMRKKVISLAYHLGWIDPLQPARVDQSALHHFLTHRTAPKKPLQQLTERELVGVISQLERILAKEYAQ